VLSRWGPVDISELWLEGHGVDLVAALGLAHPAEQGGEEQQPVHQQRHLHHLPAAHRLVRGKSLPAFVFLFL